MNHVKLPHPHSGANAQATAAELRTFLQDLNARKPAEILGPVAEGHLGWAIAQATVACLVLVAVLTVVPYLLSRNAPTGEAAATGPKPEEKTPATETAKTEPKRTEPATPAAPKTEPTTVATTEGKDKKGPDPAILDKLGENKTKAGTPKDPFGTNLNDLLDK